MTETRKGFGIARIMGIVFVLLVVLVAAIPFLLDLNQFRPQIESQLSGALGRDVKVDSLNLSLLSGGIQVKNISIADNPAFSSSAFVQAKSLQAGVELKPLIFSKSVRITGISLDGPNITLIRSSSGKWNISDLGSRAGAPKKVTGADSGSNGRDGCFHKTAQNSRRPGYHRRIKPEIDGLRQCQPRGE